MSANGWLQFAIYSLVLLATVRPVGIYLARVLEGERTWLDPVLRPIERLIYKLCGVNCRQGDELARIRLCHAGLLRRRHAADLRHRKVAGLSALEPPGPRRMSATDLAWNTAASFTTNTNWQFYTPESTMSYLTEMVGLATHNFWSAAAGIVVAVALIRGIKRTTSGTIGNFWVDMTRTLLYILGPDMHRLRAAAGRPGRPAKSESLYRGASAGAAFADPDHRAGPGCFAGSHQDAGHQRRRFLQRQQRPPV